MKKKIKGSNTIVQSISQAKVRPEDGPNHELTLDAFVAVTSSPDDDWNQVRLTEYFVCDLVDGSGSIRGYSTHHHKGGDKSHFCFEASLDSATSTVKGTFRWTGGTGRFENIKGNGTFWSDTSNHDAVSWEGEVEY